LHIGSPGPDWSGPGYLFVEDKTRHMKVKIELRMIWRGQVNDVSPDKTGCIFNDGHFYSQRSIKSISFVVTTGRWCVVGQATNNKTTSNKGFI
jgi:hypothetical protein